jgi:hypothetical protein
LPLGSHDRSAASTAGCALPTDPPALAELPRCPTACRPPQPRSLVLGWICGPVLGWTARPSQGGGGAADRRGWAARRPVPARPPATAMASPGAEVARIAPRELRERCRDELRAAPAVASRGARGTARVAWGSSAPPTSKSSRRRTPTGVTSDTSRPARRPIAPGSMQADPSASTYQDVAGQHLGEQPQEGEHRRNRLGPGVVEIGQRPQQHRR